MPTGEALLAPTTPLFIGWDVGGWNCDKNPASRDALVVLDAQRQVIGKPWRGNMRRCINQAADTAGFIARLLELCELDVTTYASTPVVLAIDTPLGFSTAFIELIVQGRAAGPIGNAASNPYLYRRTERYLFERGLMPLSAIKDMIGSQATKGMHVLARFAPHIQSPGVWTDHQYLRAIEAYPSAAKRSAQVAALLAELPEQGTFAHADIGDAHLCALVAWQFHYQPLQLVQPEPGVDSREGWIYVPVDSLSSARTSPNVGSGIEI
ncbi:hypothetical protein HNP29_001129 [Pseudomonas alcaligenes]|nr:hypothetical protein [Pseudomonas alcaligenes]